MSLKEKKNNDSKIEIKSSVIRKIEFSTHTHTKRRHHGRNVMNFVAL